MTLQKIKSAQSRNRTSDTRIFSPLLYQLSYLGERFEKHLSQLSFKNLVQACLLRGSYKRN